MIRGSCLCGAVQYAIEGGIDWLANCHCSMCRKWHGAPFATYAGVSKADFQFTKGEELTLSYRSSQHVERVFCSRCGSSLLFTTTRGPDHLLVTAGTLDDDPGVRCSGHIFTGSKAPWYEITDDLAQFEVGWPARPS